MVENDEGITPITTVHEVYDRHRERKHIKQYGCNLFTLDGKYLTCRDETERERERMQKKMKSVVQQK